MATNDENTLGTREGVIAEAVLGGDERSNPQPANEEGPHLDDPANRDTKRKQLRAAGLRKGVKKMGNTELSDTLQKILQEG